MKTKNYFLTVFLCILFNVTNQKAYSQCYDKIVVSQWQSATLRTNGTLWIWGNNYYGQLGDGTIVGKDVPIQIGTSTNWQDIDVHFLHSIGINNGSLYAWGKNDVGQLGDGTLINKPVPTQIGSATNWKSVAAGEDYSLAIKINGTLWSFGRNNSGQLGTGNTINSNVPVQVGTDTNWLKVAAGSKHAVALKTDGTLWAWGAATPLGGTSAGAVSIPTQIGVASNWKEISIFYEHALALKNDGTMWSWGFNFLGQLGTGNSPTSELNNNPMQIGIGTWRHISAGRDFSIAIKTNGTLWAWGLNDDGQYGNNTVISSTTPIQIGTATNWRTVEAGYAHCLSKKIATDQLWVWGKDPFGVLGLGNIGNQLVPVVNGTCTTLKDINFNYIDNSASIFPNPANSYIKITTSDNSKIYNIKIINLLGKNVLDIKTDFDFVDVSMLEQSLYIIEVKTNNSTSFLKFIKN